MHNHHFQQSDLSWNNSEKQTSGYSEDSNKNKPILVTVRYKDIFILCLHAIVISATIQHNIFSKQSVSEPFKKRKAQCFEWTF